MCSSVSSRLRSLLSLALLAIVAAMPSAARAQACQASGSIQVNPQSATSCATGVLAGGTLDISYFITNTSSNGTPGPQVAAVLSGTTVATLACDNSSCALQGDPATFVPVGVDGCVAKAAGVLNCSAGGVNQAVINMAAGGVALAAGQQIFLATIRVQVGANAVTGCVSRFTRADTGPDDMATNDPACDPAVSGGGQGSSSFKKVECTTGVQCRPSSGQCDVAETCTANTCPPDGKAPSTTTCIGTSNGGPCDGTDSCDGAGNCVDGFKPMTTTCRPAVGQCDVAESCSGTTGSCPADGFQPSTTTCVGTSNGGPCDGTDSCDGNGNCVDGFKPMTTTCRPAVGQCDVAESCSGTSGSCPANGFQPSTTTCVGTSNGGACDGTDSCDGNGNCVDGYKPSTTICRAAAGQCDVAESCSGSSSTCPADGFMPSTTACTGTSNGGACDGTDSCDGNGHCVDGYKPATTICRAAAGTCDVAESCTGSSGSCPSDVFMTATTPCSPELCQSCSGNSASCPTTNNCGGEGCTPGFWKNNAAKWNANAWPVSPNALVSSVFTIPACIGTSPVNFGNETLQAALQGGGGGSLNGAAQILIRAAVAAKLNAISTCVNYSLGDGDVVSQTNAALATCNKNRITLVGGQLDALNNAGGCPVNQHGQCMHGN